MDRKSIGIAIAIGLPALGIILPLIFASKGHKTLAAIAGGGIGLVLAGPALIVANKILDKGKSNFSDDAKV